MKNSAYLFSLTLFVFLTISPRVQAESSAHQPPEGVEGTSVQAEPSTLVARPQAKASCETQYFHGTGGAPILYLKDPGTGKLYFRPSLELCDADVHLKQDWSYSKPELPDTYGTVACRIRPTRASDEALKTLRTALGLVESLWDVGHPEVSYAAPAMGEKPTPWMAANTAGNEKNTFRVSVSSSEIVNALRKNSRDPIVPYVRFTDPCAKTNLLPQQVFLAKGEKMKGYLQVWQRQATPYPAPVTKAVEDLKQDFYETAKEDLSRRRELLYRMIRHILENPSPKDKAMMDALGLSAEQALGELMLRSYQEDLAQGISDEVFNLAEGWSHIASPLYFLMIHRKPAIHHNDRTIIYDPEHPAIRLAPNADVFAAVEAMEKSGEAKVFRDANHTRLRRILIQREAELSAKERIYREQLPDSEKEESKVIQHSVKIIPIPN